MSRKNRLQRIRPWIYFAAFISVYGALSTMPDLEDYFQYVWFTGILVFSAIILRRWWNDPQDPRVGGLGISRLPLPERWKRWIYDEPDDSKERDRLG